MGALDSIWKRNLAALEPYWEQVLGILGDGGSVLPLVGLGDDGLPGTTTFKSRRRTSSGIEATFTWDAALALTEFDPTDPAFWQGIAPLIKFDGASTELSTPDTAHWSHVGEAFSFGFFAKINAITGSDAVFHKHDFGSNREWYLEIISSDWTVELYDQSVSGFIKTQSDANVTLDKMQSVVVTVDGSANASGTDIYVDGEVIASTDSAAGGGFVAMEDLTHAFYFANLGGGNHLNADVAGGPLGPFHVDGKAHSAAEVKRLYNLGRAAMGLG